MADGFGGRKIHFMGAGGIGMSALAELAHARGATVNGCDREENENTERLEQGGIRVSLGHDESHALDCDTLVYTSAVPPEHPELARAGGRAVKRGKFLADLMRGAAAIGVCGTHGKTTTTWLTAHLLICAGLDPSVVLGGVHRDLGGNVRISDGPLFVAELDESDGSFLLPELSVAAITNIESEHLHYYGDFAKAVAAYEKYARGVEKRGTLVACLDCPEAARLFAKHAGKKISYGFAAAADYRATEFGNAAGRQEFTLHVRGKDCGRFALALPGEHNVKNALGALALAVEAGAQLEALRAPLATATAVGRRMERVAQAGGATVYSDYAHHPTEVRCAILAARQLHPGKVMVAFQPHLYSRTRDYAEEFGAALALADLALLCDIYPAREEPLPGVHSGLIVEAVRRAGGKAEGPFPVEEIPRRAFPYMKQMEALILMGAGSIDKARQAF